MSINIVALLFDGIKPVAIPVTLSLLQSGWSIELPDGTLRLIEQDQLVSASDTDDETTTLLLKGGEQLVLCNDVPTELKANLLSRLQPSSKTTQRIDNWISHRRLSYTSALAVVMLPLFALMVLIPAVAQIAAVHMPIAMERALGQEILQAVNAQLMPTRLEPARRAQFQTRFQQFAKLAGTEYATLDFRRGMVNAFALPGGYVIVTDELVELMQSDDKVMGVIAHELGHVKQRHSLRQIISGTLALSVAAAALSQDQLSKKVSDLVASRLFVSTYSRDQEREADRFASDLVVRAGLSADTFAQSLQSLADYEIKKLGQVRGASYTTSHPPTSERIEAARSPR